MCCCYYGQHGFRTFPSQRKVLLNSASLESKWLMLNWLLMWKHNLLIYLLLFTHSVLSDSLWPHEQQHDRLPCPSLSPRVCSNSTESVRPSKHLILCHTSPSPPALSLSQHQGVFQWVCSSHQVAKVLELHLQQQSVFAMNIQSWFLLGLTCLISLLSKGLWRVLSSISSLVLSLLYGLTLMSVHGYWKNHSFD